jgi:glycosyltransferase involved in cell wall biosynthesis
MSPPKISVITPVYNAAPYLRALIESVLQQDYPHYEHIIIDDGSTDDGATVRILKEYSHLHWWSHANKGQYATQNDALAAATGDIVSVISADDAYVATSTFRTVAEYWRAHAGVDVIFGQTLLIDQTGNSIKLEICYPIPH